MTAISDGRVDLQGLIDAAKKATGGKWLVGSWGGQCHKAHRHGGTDGHDPCVYDPIFYDGGNGVASDNGKTVLGSDYDGLSAKPDDLAFIALANPSTVAAMAEELLALVPLKDAALGWLAARDAMSEPGASQGEDLDMIRAAQILANAARAFSSLTQEQK